MTSTPDDTAPATKADVQMLLKHLSQLYDEMATKEFVREHVHEVVAASEHRLLVVIENLRHDLLAAKKEDIENMKIVQQRITVLERAVGLPG